MSYRGVVFIEVLLFKIKLREPHFLFRIRQDQASWDSTETIIFSKTYFSEPSFKEMLSVIATGCAV